VFFFLVILKALPTIYVRNSLFFFLAGSYNNNISKYVFLRKKKAINLMSPAMLFISKFFFKSSQKKSYIFHTIFKKFIMAKLYFQDGKQKKFDLFVYTLRGDYFLRKEKTL
jgi:hypothetical protein